jgi:hypothetical protein
MRAPRPPDPPDPYLEAWDELRRRRVVMWASFLSWLPVGAICGYLLGDRVVYVVLLLMAIIVVAQFRAALFRCPQCRGFFNFRWSGFHRNPWVRKCIHCGIAIGTPKNANGLDVLL